MGALNSPAVMWGGIRIVEIIAVTVFTLLALAKRGRTMDGISLLSALRGKKEAAKTRHAAGGKGQPTQNLSRHPVPLNGSVN